MMKHLRVNHAHLHFCKYLCNIGFLCEENYFVSGSGMYVLF